jgi:hypothetical protein
MERRVDSKYGDGDPKGGDDRAEEYRQGRRERIRYH